MILIKTSMGDIKIDLHEDKTPVTCENFKSYVTSEHYKDCVFHRVIDGFMIQAGGMSADMSEKKTKDSIKNEADKGGSNKRGAIAMARTMDPHSASAQWFINLKDNTFLDHKSKDMQGWGYCVFGEVSEGLEVVDAIAKVKTGNKAGHGDVPIDPVMILDVQVVE